MTKRRALVPEARATEACDYRRPGGRRGHGVGPNSGEPARLPVVSAHLWCLSDASDPSFSWEPTSICMVVAAFQHGIQCLASTDA